MIIDSRPLNFQFSEKFINAFLYPTSYMGNKVKILYVDPEIHNLNVFKANLRLEYEIFLCRSSSEALEIIKDNTIHIAIADQRSPQEIGVEFLQGSGSSYPEPVKIVLTAHRDIQAVKAAFSSELIFGYHEKPLNFKILRKTIEAAYRKYRERYEGQILIS